MDFEPKIIRIVADFFGKLSNMQSTYPDEQLQGKTSVQKNLIKKPFKFWTKIFSDFYQILFWQRCRKCNLCLNRRFLTKTQLSRRTVKYEFVFWVWANIFLFFGINFSHGCKKCPLRANGNLLTKRFWFIE